MDFNSHIINIIDREFSIREGVLPSHEENGVLYFKVREVNREIKEKLELICGREVRLILASEEELEVGREDLYRFVDISFLFSKEEEVEEVESENSPASSAIKSAMDYCIERGGSDLHIDPTEREVIFRGRIDGVLKKLFSINKQYHSKITTRIKILSNLDISQKRLPQDGRFNYRYRNRSIDIRVATTPTVNGEKIVLRILDGKNMDFNLQTIGLSEGELATVKNLLREPSGMILISGPTGSGKTSTNYAILRELMEESKNIITIEDPVEYKLEGVNQIQVNEELGLTFERGFKSILRLDPDIVLIGEIRTGDSAEIALRAAISGKLVLSTIHTADSPSGIIRLLDMGALDYMVSAGIIAIISQRLTRVLCPKCKVKVREYSEIFGEEIESYRAVGCTECNNGYKGRRGVFEILRVSPRIKGAIVNGCNLNEVRSIALEEGMKPLIESFKELVLSGETSLDELYKNISAGEV